MAAHGLNRAGISRDGTLYLQTAIIDRQGNIDQGAMDFDIAHEGAHLIVDDLQRKARPGTDISYARHGSGHDSLNELVAQVIPLTQMIKNTPFRDIIRKKGQFDDVTKQLLGRGMISLKVKDKLTGLTDQDIEQFLLNNSRYFKPLGARNASDLVRRQRATEKSVGMIYTMQNVIGRTVSIE